MEQHAVFGRVEHSQPSAEQTTTESGATAGHTLNMSGNLPQQSITLDFAREQFYLAQRASERFASQLASFVEALQQQKEDDAWLEQIRCEADRVVHFHDEQLRQWEAISGSIEAYLTSVKQLAEAMAVSGRCYLPTTDHF